MILENSRVIRQIIREELEGAGFEVLEADTADSAFRIMQEVQLDLATLAVELPDANGYDVCLAIRKGQGGTKNRFVPVVFITGSDDMAERRRGFEVGGVDFIHKPFPQGYVSGVVRQILKPESRLEGLQALVADDSIFAREIVADALRTHGVVVHEVETGDAAYELLKERIGELDLVITDLIMPGIKGNELVHRIRNEFKDLDLPVIIMSGEDKSVSIIDLFRAGASDYLVKPFIKEEMMARVMVHLKTRLLNRQLVSKIRELEQANTRLNKLAAQDSLTNLPNRKIMFQRFQEALARRQKEELYLSFLIVDIDHFKKINDRYGHQVGDWVIQELSGVIRGVVKKNAYVGRLGGEEFGLVILSRDPAPPISIAESVIREVRIRPFLQDKLPSPIAVTISMGVYISSPGENGNVESIYKAADELLYQAKSEGRNRMVFNRLDGTEIISPP